MLVPTQKKACLMAYHFFEPQPIRAFRYTATARDLAELKGLLGETNVLVAGEDLTRLAVSTDGFSWQDFYSGDYVRVFGDSACEIHAQRDFERRWAQVGNGAPDES